jgi:hypothetical protein
MDVAGEQQIDVVRNVVKTRYAIDGRKLGRELDEDDWKRAGGKCGPCFPQLTEHHERIPEGHEKACCNSCADVKATYQAIVQRATAESKGHLPQGRVPQHVAGLHWEEHPICQHEAVLMDPSRLAAIKEGCNLFGSSR